MKLFSRLAVAAATATIAVGGGATAASAYSISGGAYVGVDTVDHTFTIGGVYTISCSSTSFAGTATGADTTSFTPTYSGCTFMGFPATRIQSGNSNLAVIDDDGFGVYSGELEIPAGTTTTVSIPLMGCTYTIAGPQTFRGGVGGNVLAMVNTGTGVDFSMIQTGIAYTASGCPFSSGSDGVYRTNGPIRFPGMTVS